MDYAKALDIVSHIWLMDALGSYCIASDLIKFLAAVMEG